MQDSELSGRILEAVDQSFQAQLDFTADLTRFPTLGYVHIYLHQRSKVGFAGFSGRKMYLSMGELPAVGTHGNARHAPSTYGPVSGVPHTAKRGVVIICCETCCMHGTACRKLLPQWKSWRKDWWHPKYRAGMRECKWKALFL